VIALADLLLQIEWIHRSTLRCTTCVDQRNLSYERSMFEMGRTNKFRVDLIEHEFCPSKHFEFSVGHISPCQVQETVSSFPWTAGPRNSTPPTESKTTLTFTCQ
jgi:hypothetical protein